MMQRTDLTERQRFWLAHLRCCERGNKSLKAYAVENGLGVSALYEAKSTLRRKGVLGDAITRPRFVRVEHEPEPGAASASHTTNPPMNKPTPSSLTRA